MHPSQRRWTRTALVAWAAALLQGIGWTAAAVMNPSKALWWAGAVIAWAAVALYAKQAQGMAAALRRDYKTQHSLCPPHC